MGEGGLRDFAGVAYLPPGGRGRAYDAKALLLAVRLPIVLDMLVGINPELILYAKKQQSLAEHPLRPPSATNLPDPVTRPPETARNGPQGSLQPPVGCIQTLESGSLLTALSV